MARRVRGCPGTPTEGFCKPSGGRIDFMMETSEQSLKLVRVTLAVFGLGVGAGTFAWLVATKPRPAANPQHHGMAEVVVETAQPESLAFPVVSHGTVRPRKQVNIIPQVSGALTYVHPDLAQGKVIPKGELLFEVDPTIYDARLKQAEAEVAGLDAVVRRQDQDLVHLGRRLENARKLLAIDEADYQSSKNLFEVEKVGTQREVDALLQKYLRTKDLVDDLDAQLANLPLLKSQSVAQLDAAKARLSQAQHDHANTRIECPFKARVETVQANTSQVVTAFFSIATLTDMEAFELSVGVDPGDLRWLAPAIQPSDLETTATDKSPKVAVRWSLRDQTFDWAGRVSRFERVDEKTRTVRLVVEVPDEHMTAVAQDGMKLDLAIGMFCRTELPGLPLHNALLVPRHAIHEDRYVYVVEAGATGNDRLARRIVPMLRSLGDQVLVDFEGRGSDEPCELRTGERVVTSRLTKAVEGQTVRVREAVTTAMPPAGVQYASLKSIDEAAPVLAVLTTVAR